MDDTIKKYYDLLGLDYGAGEEEIKQAYTDMVKIWHPDRFNHDPRLQNKVQDKLKDIINAYEELMSFRKKYDQWKVSSDKPSSPEHSEKTETEKSRDQSERIKSAFKKPMSPAEIDKARAALLMMLFGDKKK
ncbi:DnaJ domain-containing protein [bacterium]|nr:DnaJ domain-containing protein [bacterium]